MPDREALSIYLADAWRLIIAGLARQRNGDLCADLVLERQGITCHAERAVLNTSEGRISWATSATGPDRPTAEELERAILEVLPDALSEVQRQGKPKTSDAIVEMLQDLTSDIAETVELFHTPDGEAYATIPVAEHRETWPLRSKGFRQWLAREFHRKSGSTPSGQAIQDAMQVLAGKALYEGAEHPVYTRLAEKDGVIYLDLVNKNWEVVAISPTGWEVVCNCPVKFRRSRGMLALPYPIPGGSVSRLRRFVNIGSGADWALLVSWLVGALRPSGPYPVLVLGGEQGSAKSTLARLLRTLIDPNKACLRAEPRDVRDLVIAANNGWVIALDNLSRISPQISDALCRLATGGGFATRELYTDSDEALFDAQRPIIVNGITELATRADLLDRSILLYLPTIPEIRRRTESRFWAEFGTEHPLILGAVLDAVARAMGCQQGVHLDRIPRMADFAVWATAAQTGLGLEAGAFISAYTANRKDANDLALESSLISGVVRAFVETVSRWEGTASRLLEALEDPVDDGTRRLKAWPSTAQGLSNALRRLAPNLRTVGIEVTFCREPGTGRRLIRLEKSDHSSSQASQASRILPDSDAVTICDDDPQADVARYCCSSLGFCSRPKSDCATGCFYGRGR